MDIIFGMSGGMDDRPADCWAGVPGTLNPSHQDCLHPRNALDATWKEAGYREGWPEGKGTVRVAGVGPYLPDFE